MEGGCLIVLEITQGNLHFIIGLMEAWATQVLSGTIVLSVGDGGRFSGGGRRGVGLDVGRWAIGLRDAAREIGHRAGCGRLVFLLWSR